MGAAGILLCRFRDSLTHALIHASMGSARFSKKSGWENMRFVFKCKNLRLRDLRGWFTRLGTILCLCFFFFSRFWQFFDSFLTKWYHIGLPKIEWSPSHHGFSYFKKSLKLYHLIYLGWFIGDLPGWLFGKLHESSESPWGAEQEQRLWRRLREFQLGFHQGLGAALKEITLQNYPLVN